MSSEVKFGTSSLPLKCCEQK